MSEHIVIVGGGVGGTLLANVLAKDLTSDQARVTVIDETGQHLYQPGWLYVPFGEEKASSLRKKERSLLRKEVELIVERVVDIDPVKQTVTLAGKKEIPYDHLVLGTGARITPETVPGFAEGAYHFYSSDASIKLKAQLEAFTGGRLVVGVADIPYKCPPAPLEFVFKVEEYLKKRGLREKTEILYLSPINRVFTIESVSDFATPMLEERGIKYEVFFNTEEVDPCRQDGHIARRRHYRLRPAGDGSTPPGRKTARPTPESVTSKAGFRPIGIRWRSRDSRTSTGSVMQPISRFPRVAQLLISRPKFSPNVWQRRSRAKTRESVYDGHVLCFLETGYGQASQLVFDFENPPVPPKPSAFYHYEKLMFNKVYWYIVPRGIV